MNRVWEIIEHRKSSEGEGPMEHSMGRRGTSAKRMGYKYSEEYTKGVKDGLCAALDLIEDAVHSMSEE